MDDMNLNQSMSDLGIRKRCFNQIKSLCTSKKKNKMSSSIKYQIERDPDDYLDLTNENDYADYPKLSSMSPFERELRIRELWLKAYLKAKGAAVILSTFEGLRAKI